jgi:NAD(P)-dependent dehydrogenase (short-subunit alcohol dehydrogenase family)
MKTIFATAATRGIGAAPARYFLGDGRLVARVDVGPPAAKLSGAST